MAIAFEPIIRGWLLVLIDCLMIHLQLLLLHVEHLLANLFDGHSVMEMR
jgi:hypothetical protein